MEMKFVLKGDIPSNKNSLIARLSNAAITALRKIPMSRIHDKSQTNSILRELAKFIRVTHTAKYKKWQEEAKKQILDQIEYEPFFEKVRIDYKLYFPRRGIAGGDCSNKAQSIEDVLTECGIIMDDNYECLNESFYKGIYRKGEGGAEFIIKEIK